MNLFESKTALITGGTSGIGLEIARELASQKANIVLLYRDVLKYELVCSEIKKLGVSVDGIRCDLSDEAEVRKVQKIVSEISIDILVNSAGVFPIKSILNSTESDYDECFNVNVKAPFLLSKSVARQMVAKRWGRIINIGSSSCYNGSGETGLYCSSKHALLGLSRSLFKELKQYNIRTFNVSPGSTQTRMGVADTRQDFSTFITPQEVAKYVCFVASFDSEGVSEEIRINRIEVK